MIKIAKNNWGFNKNHLIMMGVVMIMIPSTQFSNVIKLNLCRLRIKRINFIMSYPGLSRRS